MDAYLIEAKRTPIGRAHKDKGIFKNIRADELLAKLIEDFLQKGLPLENLDDVYVGCVGQHLEQGKNIARLALLLANLPAAIPGTTINRLCASSLQAFHFAATTLHSRQADLILAGGVEHMHHVPMTAALDYNQKLLDRYEFPFTNMGLTAEKVAKIYEISREEQDRFALASHHKAALAQSSGNFDAEILPIIIDKDVIKKDQGPREDSTLEKLGALPAAFKEGGTVTAGNSSQLSDGASLTLLASKKACQKLNLKPRAQVLDLAVVGVDPCLMGMGPVPAVQKLLEKNDLTIDDIDAFELNEAFASQTIACMRSLKIPASKLNPCGGAIALGHPLGCTGTRLVTTLVHHLERINGKLGIVAMCIGHGQGMATLIQRGGE